MSLYHQFFDRFILPMFHPSTIARSLAKKNPVVAAGILSRLKPKKAVMVLSYWKTGVRKIILNEMGQSVIRLLDMMTYEDRARMLVSLNSKIIKRYSKNINAADLSEMKDFWSEDDLKVVMMRVSPERAGDLIAMMETDEKILVLADLKPWVQASLMEKLDPTEKAAVIDKLDFSLALELFARWSIVVQSDVLSNVSSHRQQEVFRVLSPKNISSILDNWGLDRTREILFNLDIERQLMVFTAMDQDTQSTIFPDMPEALQIKIINGIDAADAVKLLELVPEDVNTQIMKSIDEDQAAGIRMASLMR